MDSRIDRKQAFEILGLPEDAAREEIERKYFLLLKKTHAEDLKEPNSLSDDSESSRLTVDKLNEAYEVIMGIEKTDPKVKLGWNKESVGHFFHYYKIHVIVAVILLAVAGYTIKEYVDNQRIKAELALLPDPDVQVLFVGNFSTNEDGVPEIEKQILDMFPEWERVTVDFVYRPLNSQDPMDAVLLQKSIVDLMTKRGDVYIMDKDNYEQLVIQDIFDTQILGDQGSVDVSANSLWTEIPMTGREEQKIAAIFEESEHKEQALKLIEKLQQNP